MDTPDVLQFAAAYERAPVLFDEDPLEVLRRNVWIHIFRDDNPLELISILGVANSMFGSDFHHPEGLRGDRDADRRGSGAGDGRQSRASHECRRVSLTRFGVGIVSADRTIVDFLAEVSGLDEREPMDNPAGTLRRLESPGAVINVMVTTEAPKPAEDEAFLPVKGSTT